MPFRVDPSKYKVFVGDPPPPVGTVDEGPNPCAEMVAEAETDRRWRAFSGVSTKQTIEAQHPHNQSKTKVSEVYELAKTLRRAATKLGVSIKTRKVPDTRKDTVVLYWLVVDKITRKSAEDTDSDTDE